MWHQHNYIDIGTHVLQTIKPAYDLNITHTEEVKVKKYNNITYLTGAGKGERERERE